MKHQSYIRSLFVAFCAFFVCVSAMAETTATTATGQLNPFAFKLSNVIPDKDAEGNLMQDYVNVTYRLNADATSAVIRFWYAEAVPADNIEESTWSQSAGNTGQYIAEYPLTGEYLKKGEHTYKVDFTDLIGVKGDVLDTKKVRWTIDVEGGNSAVYPSKANGDLLAAQEISTNYNFYNAGSIDIDINPYSENFGLIYVLERRKSTTTEDYFSTKDKTTQPGIYVFDPAFQNMPVTRGKYDFETGTNYTDAQLAYSFNATNYNTINGHYDLANLLMSARIAYDDDNETRLFVSCQTQSGPILMYGSAYYLNCTRGAISSNWYHYVISGDRSADYSLKSGSDFVAAPNIAFDIQGNKSSRKAMMFSAAGENLVSGDDELERENYRCDEYSLANYNYALNTTSSPLNCKPTLTGIIDLYKKNGVSQPNSWYLNSWSPKMQGGHEKMIGFNVQLDLLGLEYDKDGNGFWLCQTRDHHSGMPSLTHFKYNSSTKKYEVNFIEYWANRGRSAVRYDINHERLAVSGGKYYIKESESGYSDSKFPVNSVTKSGNTYYKHPAATPNYATIYTINNSELNTNFIGNLTDEQTTAGTTVTSRAIFSDSAYIDLNGCKAADFAWDFADNLYVAMGADHKVTAFALPHNGKEVSTPCKEEYEFRLSPVHEFYTSVNPTVDGADKYATIIHERIGKEPYEHYLNKAKMDLRADVINGCKFYQWKTYGWDNPQTQPEVKTLRTYPKTDGNTFLQDGLTEQLEVIAEIGICVYEHEAPLAVKAETTFPAAFVKRELDNANYSTICLPFDLKTLEGTPWEGASVLRMKSALTLGEGADKVTYINFVELGFTNNDDDYIHACRPYLIKLADNAKNISKEEEKIFIEARCPKINNLNSYGGLTDGSLDLLGVAFHGVLNPSPIANDENTLFLVADNRLAKIVGKDEVSLNGLRAFFTVNPEKVGKIELRLPDKIVTSVPTFSIDTLKPTKYLWNGKIYIQRGNNVYDLSGNCVR